MPVISSRLLRRVSWNLVDQGLSAASNFALAIIVARSVSATEFGAFSIAFLVYGIAVAATKSMVGQPLQMKFSGVDGNVQRRAVSSAFGFVVPLGLCFGAIAAATGLWLPGAVAPSLIALAVVLPGLLLQDSCRMAFFAVGKPSLAALIDLVWGVGQIAILGAMLLLGRDDAWLLILGWGCAAAISAVVGLLLLRARPALGSALGWFRDQRQLIRYLFPEYLLGLGAAQFGMLLVGVVATADAVGSIRAAQVLLGPLGIVGTAAFQFAVPEMAARPTMSSRHRTMFGLGVSAALGMITTVYCTVLLLMPDSFGTAMFGASWAGASAVLLAMCLSSLASSLANGPAGVLYALGRAQWTFRINVVKGPIALVALLAGAAVWGASGAAWAFFLIELAVLPAWLLTFRKAIRTSGVTDDAVSAALAGR
jgi:O-antigen/teichoic acid export membrane protein